MNDRIKNLIMWNHGRETSAYVIFCLLIVAFIFLTPKTWFTRTENAATQTSKLIVQEGAISPNAADFEAKVRELSGNSSAEVVQWRRRSDSAGSVFYEIEYK